MCEPFGLRGRWNAHSTQFSLAPRLGVQAPASRDLVLSGSGLCTVSLDYWSCVSGGLFWSGIIGAGRGAGEKGLEFSGSQDSLLCCFENPRRRLPCQVWKPRPMLACFDTIVYWLCVCRGQSSGRTDGVK